MKSTLFGALIIAIVLLDINTTLGGIRDVLQHMSQQATQANYIGYV